MNKYIQALMITGTFLKRHKDSLLIAPIVRAEWANEILKTLNFKISSDKIETSPRSMIYVSNHISYIDIPLLMATVEDCVFISKREVSWWPIFGRASRRIGTIFVDRSSSKSRSLAREEIELQLSTGIRKIVVFPSGTTSITHEKQWKKGIFEVAMALNVPIQPIRISYSDLRTVAYIDSDFFPYHLFQLTKLSHIVASVEVHKPIVVKNVLRDLEYCRDWCSEKTEKQTRSDSGRLIGNLTKA